MQMHESLLLTIQFDIIEGPGWLTSGNHDSGRAFCNLARITWENLVFTFIEKTDLANSWQNWVNDIHIYFIHAQ